LSPSGDATSPWYVHVAWDAYEYSNRVIIHRLASTADWNFGSQYYQLHYQTEDRPSISGLAGNTAQMVYQRGANYHFTAHFEGSGWIVQFPAISGFHPSLSAGNTSAKYLWSSGSNSPYTVNISSGSFSKTSGNDQYSVAYHRSVAVVDTATGGWFEVRIEGMALKTSRATTEIAFSNVASSFELTPTNAMDGLSSQSIIVPAEAESLFVRYAISGEKLSIIKNATSPLRVELAIVETGGNTTPMPVFAIDTDSLEKKELTIAVAASAFAGKEIILRTRVNGISLSAGLVASPGHIYQIMDGAVAYPEAQNQQPGAALPGVFALQAFPNPFNPSTKIQFSMPAEGLVTLRIYNLQGQLVRDLLHEQRPAGTHTVTWDGRDDRGIVAASGIYFVRLESGKQMKINKLTLVR
jgi:hypothetical protein